MVAKTIMLRVSMILLLTFSCVFLYLYLAPKQEAYRAEVSIGNFSFNTRGKDKYYLYVGFQQRPGMHSVLQADLYSVDVHGIRITSGTSLDVDYSRTYDESVLTIKVDKERIGDFMQVCFYYGYPLAKNSGITSVERWNGSFYFRIEASIQNGEKDFEINMLSHVFGSDLRRTMIDCPEYEDRPALNQDAD